MIVLAGRISNQGKPIGNIIRADPQIVSCILLLPSGLTEFLKECAASWMPLLLANKFSG